MGLDETLAVKRLGLPERLERQLSTTNAIEHVIGSMRRISRTRSSEARTTSAGSRRGEAR
jgi:transposase-like protein